MWWRAGWLILGMILAGCGAKDEVKTHTESMAAAPMQVAAALDEENNEIDEGDTAWLDDIELQLPEVWQSDRPPLSIETRHFTHPGGLRDHYVILRARDDVLELRGLELNRGNCPYSETSEVRNGVDWPQSLRFGQRKQVRAKCDAVIEAVVHTQYGAWTFTFD